MVALLVLSVYHSVANSARRTRERELVALPLAQTLERLRQDVRCAWVPDPGLEDVFALNPADADATEPASLTLYTSIPAQGEKDLKWAEPLRVRYTLTKAANPGTGSALLRQATAICGTSAVRALPARTLLQEIETLDLAVSDGQKWTNAWDYATRQRLPQTARVRITLRTEQGAREFRDEIPIGAGQVISNQSAAPR